MGPRGGVGPASQRWRAPAGATPRARTGATPRARADRRGSPDSDQEWGKKGGG
jgi:hypothetical protein